MQRRLPLIACLLLGTFCSVVFAGEDIVLLDGTILRNATIVGISEKAVIIGTPTGLKNYPLSAVPLEALGRASIRLNTTRTEKAKSPVGQTSANPVPSVLDGPTSEPTAQPSQTQQATAPTGAATANKDSAPTQPEMVSKQATSPSAAENGEPPTPGSGHSLSFYVASICGGAALTFLVVVVLLRRQQEATKKSLAELNERYKSASEKLASLSERFSSVINIEEERAKILAEVAALKESIANEKVQFAQAEEATGSLRQQLSIYQEQLELVEFGHYQRHYDFDISQRFKDATEVVRDRQKQMLKDGNAVLGNKAWTLNGSVTEGRKLTKRYERLMLRAFNGEADATIADVRWSNVNKMEARLDASFTAINKLAESYELEISRDYFKLKLDELRLTYEYQEKLRAEKEEQRRIQEQIREEERAQREIEQALREAADEESRYQKALERAKVELASSSSEETEKMNRKIEHLEMQLREAQTNKARAIARAQITKSGHVYIISNIGSFGENRFKIGMTRRLEPMDRVRELGDASVPFEFDVHAIIYTENAPDFERQLHQSFDHRRVNLVNERKEFFDVSLDEIEQEVRKLKADIEIIKVPEARDYRQTLAKRAVGNGAKQA